MSSLSNLRPPATNKYRVLCLHGYLQNSDVFRSKMGSWRKALKSSAEFLYIDAPHIIETHDEEEVNAAGGSHTLARGWWRWKDAGPHMRPSLATKYVGWEESLVVLIAALETHHPDGILGFSQGATATALLLAHLSRTRPNLLPKFTILVGGFLPWDTEFANSIATEGLSLPILTIMGESDQLVPLSRSVQLCEALNSPSPEYYKHGGAHMMPTCSGPCKQQIAAFLAKVSNPGIL